MVMAATASSRANPPLSGRQSHFTSTSPPPNFSIAKGATARSALTNSRVSANVSSAAARRHSLKGATQSHVDGREAHVHRDDTEERDRLLLQLQHKDQTISTLTQTNNSLSYALNEADSRLNDFYADQSRMEEEMSARIEVADKLRAQVRELEKEKRDIQRRYNEQTSTFDAERQAFYDNEQHLKSRIQSLSQVRRQPVVTRPPESDVEHDSDDSDTESSLSRTSYSPKQSANDEESEPAEMTALKLELSTLSTSYSSLQTTLVLLQTQLVDLKRVNNELQEENESYMILLREKTLSGQFDLLKQVGTTSTTEGDDDDMYDTTSGADESSSSLKSSGRSTLDRVDEMSEHEHDHEFDEEDTLDPDESEAATAVSRHTGRHSHKHSSSLSSPGGRAPRGESLAGLPITGPGLDLAAELGRAENKDIIGGTSIEDSGTFPYGKGKRGKKGSSESRKVSTTSEGVETGAPASDLDALRSEVKSLKDANKALSLYASKIIDRIIAEEGFEHVLSIDYEKSPITPSATTPRSPFPPPIETAKTARRHSAIFARSTSGSGQIGETSPNPLSASQPASSKAQRRSLSFDWKNFSMFGGGEKKNESSNLRPLTLKPGTSSVTGARKLETYEDEEDRRERERLNATMKLMGLEKPSETPVIIRSELSSPAPPMQKSYSSPASPPATTPSRFSFFRSQTSKSETSSIHSAHSAPNSHLSPYGLGIDGNAPSELTHEALEHVEAQNALVALDTHEKALSEEIAKGSRSGFTELSRRSSNIGEDRRSRRSRRSAGGSGSTVWSAGMSRSGDEPEVV